MSATYFQMIQGSKVYYIEKRDKTNVAKNEYMREVHRCSQYYSFNLSVDLKFFKIKS